MSDSNFELLQLVKSLSERVDSLNEKINALADSMDKELVFIPEKYEVQPKKKIEEESEKVAPIAFRA